MATAGIFFFEAALTSCGILIVDCKTENVCGYVNVQSLYQPVLLFSESFALETVAVCFLQTADEWHQKPLLN
jgi:hypothetical protein